MTPLLLYPLERLGFETSDDEAIGVFADRHVRVSAEDRRDAPPIVSVRVAYKALDIGLEIRQRAFVPLLGEPEAATGDPALDAQYVFTCDERAQVRALVTGPLAAALSEAYMAVRHIVLGDDGCTERLTGFDLDAVTQCLDRLTALAQLVDDARPDIPAPRSLAAHADALASWARRRSLRFVPSPLQVRGEIEDHRVSIRAVREHERRHHFEVHSRYTRKLELGLELHDAGRLARVAHFFGRHDVELGAPAFDDRFEIRLAADAEALAPRLFDPEIRALLLDVDSRRGPVRVGDNGISVGPIEPSAIAPADLVELGEALVEATTRIERAVRGNRGQQPYR